MHIPPNSISHTRLDVDGLPSFQAIEVMSQDEVTTSYTTLAATNRQLSLNFLAKVAVAAQRLGLEGSTQNTRGYAIFSRAVELYTNHLNISPQQATPQDISTVASDLRFRTTGYLGQGVEALTSIRDICIATNRVFRDWVAHHTHTST